MSTLAKVITHLFVNDGKASPAVRQIIKGMSDKERRLVIAAQKDARDLNKQGNVAVANIRTFGNAIKRQGGDYGNLTMGPEDFIDDVKDAAAKMGAKYSKAGISPNKFSTHFDKRLRENPNVVSAMQMEAQAKKRIKSPFDDA